MRIADLLYFAPDVRFDQVDLDGRELPKQFGQRVAGLYIIPAEECSERGYAFAAGALLVSCIDSLARLRFGAGVGRRFKRFACEELQSFSNAELAERFYDDFRNGLLHEGRVKEGGQFSFEITSTLQELGGILLVNPKLLAAEVWSALRAYVALLERDAVERAKLAKTLTRDLAKDFLVAKAN